MRPKSEARNHPRIPMINGEDFPLCVRRQLAMTASRDSKDESCFDDAVVTGLLGSLSLDFSEKCRVVDTPLSRFQHDSLLDVWRDEAEKLALMAHHYPQDMLPLIAKTVFVGFRLASYKGLSLSSEVEDALACRMARHAGRSGAANLLRGLPDSFWLKRNLCSWYWRHLLPRDHAAWKAAPPISSSTGSI